MAGLEFQLSDIGDSGLGATMEAMCPKSPYETTCVPLDDSVPLSGRNVETSRRRDRHCAGIEPSLYRR